MMRRPPLSSEQDDPAVPPAARRKRRSLSQEDAPADPEHAAEPSGVNPLLERQLMEAADSNGKVRVRELVRLVSRQYDAFESDRNSLATVMQIASDEA
ncbi:MAG TPA: hypothetical protein VFG48_11590, partial [Xanthomonadales bacterium]|nr:hypothetical protein [Xanthomonadales bacterium]